MLSITIEPQRNLLKTNFKNAIRADLVLEVFDDATSHDAGGSQSDRLEHTASEQGHCLQLRVSHASALLPCIAITTITRCTPVKNDVFTRSLLGVRCFLKN